MSDNLPELNEIERIKNRISELNKKEADYAKKSSQYSKRKLKEVQSEISEQEKLLKLEQIRLTGQKELQKEQTTFAKSFAKLNSNVKKLLVDQNTERSIYQSISHDIAKSKVKQKRLTGEELELEIEREQYLAEINSSLLQQAQTTAKAEADMKGLSDFEQKRLEIKQNSLKLSDEELKRAENAVTLQETLFLKQQRLQEIENQRKDLMSELPGPIKESIGFVKKLGVAMKAGFGPLLIAASILLLAIKSFKDLDDAAKDFRDTTGLTNSQMEGIRSDVNSIVGQFAGLGVVAKDVFNTISALKSEFSDISNFSNEVVGALTVLNKNFGVSAESAAKTQAILENIGGLSAETAASVQLQVVNMANLAGVAPAKVIADIAESAEIASTFFKGDIQSLAKAAIEARRLGTTIQRTADIAKGLLDFESSITSELEASAILGQSINFNKARGLAFDGDTIGAQKEILNQIRSIGNFQELDIFQKEAIANASGMTVEEISKQLKMGEKLASLSKEERDAAESAMEMGLDITNIKKEDLATQIKAFSTQQEQQAVLEQLSNQFTGIASTVGSVLVPLLEVIAPILGFVLTPITAIVQGMSMFVNYVKESLPLMSALVGFAGTYLFLKNKALIVSQAEAAWELVKIGYQTTLNSIVAAGNLIKKKGLLSSIAEMAMRAFSSLSAIPIIGPALGVAAAAGAFALGYSYYSKAGDLSSPADGKTRVSTKEGGLFELSPNDDLIAAPGLLSQSTSSPITSTVATTPNTTNMSELIQEIRGLRKDLNDGKVAVYMDGRKVTASVSRVVDRMGTNMYG